MSIEYHGEGVQTLGMADRMTLAVLATCAFFLTRRMVLKNRHDAGLSDFLLILITGLPFLTGFFLTHGTLDSIPFFETYLWYMHVISGEIMLVMIVSTYMGIRSENLADYRTPSAGMARTVDQAAD